MDNRHWILNDKGEPELAELMVWAKWFEEDARKGPEGTQRRAAWTELKTVHVSTVFLGMDYSFGVHSKPLLWETMVFENKLTKNEWPSGKHDREITYHKEFGNYQERHATKEEAIKRHNEIVAELKAKDL